MHRQNTRKMKKIATFLAVILGCIVWGLIISFVIRTESNRKMVQEKMQTQISQSVNTEKKESLISDLVNKGDDTITSKQDVENETSIDSDNAMGLFGNSTDEYDENIKTKRDEGTLHENDIESNNKSQIINNASREDILTVVAP